MKNNYLVWLAWPEKCFRTAPADKCFLKSLLPRGSRVSFVSDQASFLKALPAASHVITWHFREEWFGRAGHLRLLATPSAGRELMPTSAPKGVRIHFGGFHGAIISESVLAFVLAWTHGFFHVRSVPLWPRSHLAEVVARDLNGSRAVILGFGRIGQSIAARLEAFGVSVFGVSRHLKIPQRVIDHELRRADWLIAALPSTTGTDNLIDAALLSKVPSRCVFVNVGRGNCVDEKDLLKALREKRLAGAYLDVFQREPTVLVKKSMKRGGVDLARLPASKCPWNLIRMPHASAYSPSYLRMAFQELKDDGCL